MPRLTITLMTQDGSNQFEEKLEVEFPNGEMELEHADKITDFLIYKMTEVLTAVGVVVPPT